MKDVTNNVFVFAARFASQLHFDGVAREFVESYRMFREHKKYVVMEALASMVHVTMGNNGIAYRYTVGALRLSEEHRNALYAAEIKKIYDFLVRRRGF